MALDGGLIAAFVILTALIVALAITFGVLYSQKCSLLNCNSSPPAASNPIYIVNQSTVATAAEVASYVSGVQGGNH